MRGSVARVTHEWEFAEHADDAEATFGALADRVVDGLLARDPVTATWLGDHRFDDRLADLSEEGVRESLSVLDQALSAVDQVDDLALGTTSAVDLEILRSRLTGERVVLQDIAPHTWDPLEANPGTAIHLLLSRDYAPLEDRLASVAARLAAVPEALEDARRSLGEMPRVHVETAIGQFEGTRAMLVGTLEEELDRAPSARRAVEPARSAALGAIDAHVGWLRDRLESGVANADPRLGPERYAAKLWATLDADLTPDDVLHRAESDLARLEGEIARAAADYLGEPVPPPDDAGSLVRRALDLIADEARVTDENVLALCESAFVTTTDFVRELDIVTVHDVPVEIVEMPEIHRGVAVAYCDAPGPLETTSLPTFFAVSPTPADWDAGRVASFYREYNARMLQNLTVHEAMPGHYLEGVHSAKHPSTLRAVLRSGPFAEGWAVYTEDTMADAGYLDSDPLFRLVQLKFYLRAVANSILDQGRTGYTYGALATPIAFLLFAFFLGLAIMLGAELNNAIQEEWPAAATHADRVRGWLVYRRNGGTDPAGGEVSPS